MDGRARGSACRDAIFAIKARQDQLIMQAATSSNAERVDLRVNVGDLGPHLSVRSI